MGYLDRAQGRWQERRKDIPEALARSVTVTQSAQVTIAASAAAVWDFVQDLAVAELTSEMAVARFQLPNTPTNAVGMRVVTVQRGQNGTQIGLVQELVEYEAGRRAVWKSLSMDSYLSIEEVLPLDEHSTVLRVSAATTISETIQDRIKQELRESQDSYVARVREIIEARER